MPLYAFIYILLYFSFILKIVICTHLYYFIAYYIISCYLSFAKSKLYILYLSHTRAGFSGGRAFLGRFSDFWGVLGGRIRYSVVLWIVGGRSGRIACAFVRVFPCVRARGCTPAIFRARPIPGSLLSHSVRRICGGVSRGCEVSASECVYCIIFNA